MLLQKILVQVATIAVFLLPVGVSAFEGTVPIPPADFSALHRYVVETSSAKTKSAETCLTCHGPFKALQERTAGYVAPSGVPVNPHVTFDMSTPTAPHAPGADPIECTECHQSHAVPITEPLPPANIDMCVACHHTGTFRSCAECH